MAPLAARGAGVTAKDFFFNEGNAGITTVSIQLVLTQPANGNVSGQYQTADGTATAGVDYQAATGKLTFGPGQPVSQIVTVIVNGDTTFESNETLTLTVAPAGGAAAIGTGTIVNDDQVAATVGNVSVVEGNS